MTSTRLKNLLPFAALFVYLIVLYQAVPLLWDDFAYSTLSFKPSVVEYTTANANGVNWTFPQMFEYLEILYKNWTGRILFHGIYLPLIRAVPLFRIICAAATAVVFKQITMLCDIKGDKLKFICACGAALMFFCLPFGCYSDQWLWLCATAFYVLPLPFFLGTLLAARNLKKTPMFILAAFCALITGLSSELISLTICGVLVLELFFKAKESGLKGVKAIDGRLLTVFIFACLGTAFQYTAPGNFNRAETVSPNPLKLAEIFTNTLFSADAALFTLLLCAFACFLVHYELEGKITELVFFWSAVTYSLSFVPWNNSGIAYAVFSANCWIYLILFLVLCVRYMFRKNRRTAAFLLISGTLAGMTPIFYNYDIFARMEIQIHLAVFISAVQFFADFTAEYESGPKKKKNGVNPAKFKKTMTVVSALILSASALYRGADLLIGYYGNKPIHDYNEKQFEDAAKQYKADGTYPESVVMKTVDFRYATLNPYAGYPQIDYAEHYGFPREVYVKTPFLRTVEVYPDEMVEYYNANIPGCVDENGDITYVPWNVKLEIFRAEDRGEDIKTMKLTPVMKSELKSLANNK